MTSTSNFQPRTLTPDMTARVRWLIHESGVVPILERELRKDLKKGVDRGRGRPRVVSVEALLLAIILCVQVHRTMVMRSVHSVLTHELDVKLQQQLGVRWQDEDGAVKVAKEAHVTSTLQAIADALAHTDVYACGVDQAERERRQVVWQDVLDRLVAASHGPFEPGGDLALDGCGIDAHCTPMRKGDRTAQAARVIAAGGEAAARKAGLGIRRTDWDARGGKRTRTRRKSALYYGFDLQAAVWVNGVNQPDAAPMLIESFVLSPAMPDVGTVCLSMLDRALARRGAGWINDLIVDRFYSFQDPEKWARQLIERDIDQVADLHGGESSVADHDGTRMIAGWPYCPGMPQELVHLPRPDRWTANPGAAKNDLDRKKQEKLEAEIAEFKRMDDLRSNYAMTRDQGFRERNGKLSERYRCPALESRIRCKKLEASLDLDMDSYLTVGNPPAAQLGCCAGSTFYLPFEAMPKMRQKLRWGSKKWRKSNGRRSLIESIFSNIQSPNTENLAPGSIQVFGLVKNGLLAACAISATNVRLGRAYARENGMLDGRHALLTPDPVDDRWVETYEAGLEEDDLDVLDADIEEVDEDLVAEDLVEQGAQHEAASSETEPEAA